MERLSLLSSPAARSPGNPPIIMQSRTGIYFVQRSCYTDDFYFLFPRLHCQCDTFFKRDCTLPLNCMVQYLVLSHYCSHFMGIRHARPFHFTPTCKLCYVMKAITVVLYFCPTFVCLQLAGYSESLQDGKSGIRTSVGARVFFYLLRTRLYQHSGPQSLLQGGFWALYRN